MTLLKEHKKFERLMLFREVATQLSFTQAASQIGISRGHLSSQIRALEHELRLKLFVRTTRSVSLTPAGQQVLAGMEDIRSSLLALERTANVASNTVEGLIRITAPKQFTERYLLNICTEFKTQFPKVDFSIDCSFINYDLHKDNFDLAFRATQSPPQNMIAKPLFSYRHSCVASPQYFTDHGTPLVPDDLLNHQCLSGHDQSEWQFATGLVDISGWLQLNDNFLLRDMAVAGKGIIKVPEYLVQEEVDNGCLIKILDDYITQQNQIYIVHPQLIQQPKRLSQFVEFTQGKFANKL